MWPPSIPATHRPLKERTTLLLVRPNAPWTRSPTTAELADRVGIDRDEAVEALLTAEAYRPLSLEAPNGGPADTDPGTVGEHLTVDDPALDLVVDGKAVRLLLAQLSERQRTIVLLRFYGNQTQPQIAAQLGISQMHVSRLLAQSLQQLRRGLLGGTWPTARPRKFAGTAVRPRSVPGQATRPPRVPDCGQGVCGQRRGQRTPRAADSVTADTVIAPGLLGPGARQAKPANFLKAVVRSMIERKEGRYGASMGDLPIPSPETVRAARAHLTRRFGRGVEALLWQEHHHPLPDVEAVAKAIAAIRAAHTHEQPPTVTDLGAALVVLQAARLDMDRLEADLIAAVREAGLDWAQIAAVLELPDAAAAQERFEKLRPRLDAPVDQVHPPEPGNGRPGKNRAFGSGGPTG